MVDDSLLVFHGLLQSSNTAGMAAPGRESWCGWPVSRVLSWPSGFPLGHGRPFLWSPRCRRLRAANPESGAEMPPPPRRSVRLPSLFGLAPGGVCRAAAIAGSAVGSYPTVSPLPAEPKLDRRSVLCGTFPELALAGHWPAPYFRGARTFLQPRDHSRVQRPSSHPHRGGVAPQGRVGSSLATDCRRASVPPSATPSTHSGRQWRWNAVSRTASGRSVR